MWKNNAWRNSLRRFTILCQKVVTHLVLCIYCWFYVCRVLLSLNHYRFLASKSGRVDLHHTLLADSSWVLLFRKFKLLSRSLDQLLLIVFSCDQINSTSNPFEWFLHLISFLTPPNSFSATKKKEVKLYWITKCMFFAGNNLCEEANISNRLSLLEVESKVQVCSY